MTDNIALNERQLKELAMYASPAFLRRNPQMATALRAQQSGPGGATRPVDGSDRVGRTAIPLPSPVPVQRIVGGYQGGQPVGPAIRTAAVVQGLPYMDFSWGRVLAFLLVVGALCWLIVHPYVLGLVLLALIVGSGRRGRRRRRRR